MANPWARWAMGDVRGSVAILDKDAI